MSEVFNVEIFAGGAGVFGVKVEVGGELHISFEPKLVKSVG